MLACMHACMYVVSCDVMSRNNVTQCNVCTSCNVCNACMHACMHARMDVCIYVYNTCVARCMYVFLHGKRVIM